MITASAAHISSAMPVLPLALCLASFFFAGASVLIGAKIHQVQMNVLGHASRVIPYVSAIGCTIGVAGIVIFYILTLHAN